MQRTSRRSHSLRLENVGPEGGLFLSHCEFLDLYFFFGLAFLGALNFAAVFGCGVLGFFVGTFVAFLTFEGDFLGAAGEARFFFSADLAAAFFGALTFFPLAALCFTFGADAARSRAGVLGRQLFQSSALPT